MEKIKDIRIHDTDIHIIYARFIYLSEQDDPSRLYQFIFHLMKKYKIKSLMFTIISMFKSHLVTEENLKDYYEGGFEDTNGFDKASVDDDLETIFEQIKLENIAESILPPPLGM